MASERRMPSLPRPRLRRTGRRPSRSPLPAEPEAPRVEEIAAEGLRWVNIDAPGPAERAWLEEHFDFHALDLEDVAVAQPAAEDRRVPRVPVHRPALPGLRPLGRAAGRGRARHLRRPRLRRHDPEPAAAAGRVPVRALPREGGAARAALLARLRLPALPDRRRQLRLLLPDAAQDRQQARRARGRDLRRAAPRRSSATSPTSSRRSSTSAR